MDFVCYLLRIFAMAEIQRGGHEEPQTAHGSTLHAGAKSAGINTYIVCPNTGFSYEVSRRKLIAE